MNMYNTFIFFMLVLLNEDYDIHLFTLAHFENKLLMSMHNNHR